MTRRLILLLVLTMAVPAFCQVAYTFDQEGLATLTYNSVSRMFFSRPFGDLIQSYSACDASGNVLASYSDPTSSDIVKSTGASTIQWVLRSGLSNQATSVATLSSPDVNTLKIVYAWTNNDATNYNCRLTLTPFPLSIGVETNTSGTDIGSNLASDPAGLPSGTWGSVAMWFSEFSVPGVNIPLATWTTGNFRPAFQTRYTISDSSYETLIAPGATSTYTTWIRFGTPSATVGTLAPEAVASWRAAHTQTLTWPDRRPLCRWFMASAPYQGVTNPRGYFNASIDALGDPTGFRSLALSTADTVIATCNSMTPKCQGAILWDLEGTEFAHALTYVGYPSKLSDAAPEMNTIADEVISRIQAAGLNVGITLRPQHVIYGTMLPGTCHYDSTYVGYRDIFVNTSAYTYPSNTRIYLCTAVNTWTAQSNAGPGFQTQSLTDLLIIDALRQKIQYAVTRWGIKIFYVDTNSFESAGNPTVPQSGLPYPYTFFQTLEGEFPNVVIFPEHTVSAYFFDTSAYASAAQQGIYKTSASAREVIPASGFSFISVDGATWSAPNIADVQAGVAAGDSYQIACWFGSTSDQAPLVSAYAAAATLNSALLMSDSASGRAWSFSAHVESVYQYPLVMRVYFASSSGGIAGSTTYCEKRATVTCWQAGTQQPAATLNLSGMTHYQNRYYDFTGQSVYPGTITLLPL